MITELKAKYLDIYSTALGKMNGEHPFTYTTQGRSITQELMTGNVILHQQL